MAAYSSDPGFQAYLQDLTKRHSVTTPDRVLQPVEAQPQQMPQRDHQADLTNEIARMKGNLGDQESYLMGQLAEMGGWREGAAGRVLQALPVIRAQNGEVTGTGGAKGEKLKDAQYSPHSSSVAGGAAGAVAGPSKVKPELQQYVAKLAQKDYGWSGAEWDALADLIQRESGWNPDAQNPNSTAHGLFQFLKSTYKNYGISADAPLDAQIRAGLQYIKDRYGSPSAALQHWLNAVPINGQNVGHWY